MKKKKYKCQSETGQGSNYEQSNAAIRKEEKYPIKCMLAVT